VLPGNEKTRAQEDSILRRVTASTARGIQMGAVVRHGDRQPSCQWSDAAWRGVRSNRCFGRLHYAPRL